jgi:cysteine desulfurase
MRRVYFDNNASTPVLPEVFGAMEPYFREHFGNASSIHHHGQETRAAVERARESVAELLGCRPAEIVFTGGGTEGDNLAIFGMTRTGDHIITSTIEHHAVLNACKHLESSGCEVTYVPVDGSGQVDPDDVRRALRANTRLITIMMANNETGVLQPVEEFGKIAAEADVYFHSDGVQAAGPDPFPDGRGRDECGVPSPGPGPESPGKNSLCRRCRQSLRPLPGRLRSCSPSGAQRLRL